MNTSFIKSRRFWAMVGAAVVVYLKSKNIIGDAEAMLAETILGGFVIVRTADRFGEQFKK